MAENEQAGVGSDNPTGGPVLDDEMPTLNIFVITVAWDYDTGEVTVDSTGLNKMEAIGLLDTALDKVRNDAFWAEMDEYDEEGDE